MSPYMREIVCLANSTKKGGRCIAGKDTKTGEWIRPVGDRESAAVLPEEYTYKEGGVCQPLDIVKIPFLRADPRQHQTENHVIAPGYWTKAGELKWRELIAFLDEPKSLWLNVSHTQPGSNDCIPKNQAATLSDSLLLIEPEDFTVHVGVERPGSPYAKRGVRGEFKYRRTYYSLRITDPEIDTIFRRKGDGDYQLKNVYVCISLTEPFDDNRCHKLVAAIFSKQPLG